MYVVFGDYHIGVDGQFLPVYIRQYGVGDDIQSCGFLPDFNRLNEFRSEMPYFGHVSGLEFMIRFT